MKGDKQMTWLPKKRILSLNETITNDFISEWPTKYRIVNYKLKCNDCGKTIHKERVKVWEYDQWCDLRKKRTELPKTIKQRGYAVCEECVKRNNGLIVEEDFCMIKWLNLNIARNSTVCDMIDLDVFDEAANENYALEEVADIIFTNFKRDVKNTLTIESLRELTPIPYRELESGTYKDKEELKLAIETYLEKTKNFWLIYFSKMIERREEKQFEDFRVLSEEVLDFLKNNKRKIYVEYFYKYSNSLEKIPDAKAYEEINTDIKKAQKRINENEEKAAKIMELCSKKLMSKQYFRFFSNLVRNRIFEDIKL